MKITVRVKPNARRNEVRVMENGCYVVSVTAPPAEGRANQKVVEALADHFRKPKRQITIVKGELSRVKVVEIS